MENEFFPPDLPSNVMAANAVELTIRSIDRSTVVKISPYECAYGFRSSQFLRDLLNESRGFTYSKSIKDESARPFKYSRTIVKAPVSKKCINTFVVVEDSNHHNIMAALEYIHKGIQGLNFDKVSVLTYAKTAQYLMIDSLLDILLILSYNTITGKNTNNMEQLYRRPNEKIEPFPPSPSFHLSVRFEPSSCQLSSWEAYFVLKQLGYTTASDAKIRLHLDDWVKANPSLLKDPTLYELGPLYISGKDMAKLVSLHLAK